MRSLESKRRRRAGVVLGGVAGLIATAFACGGGDDSNPSSPNNGPDGSVSDGGPRGDAISSSDGKVVTTSDGGLPAGWLYTSGNKIFASSGGGTDTQWMGRGVNMDDLFLCGYNYLLTNFTADDDLKGIVTSLLTDWKPTFVRVSLGMDSYPTVVTWTGDASSTYQTPMTDIINMIGANPNTYVLVTLRSDTSMLAGDPGDPEPTKIPSDSTNTPDGTNFPTGTDAVYQAIVDTFANSKFVLFGLSNEPGGNAATDATIVAAMTHAAKTIRAEEDKLGVPHHLISVQGSHYTSDLTAYATTPLTIDNVVYEVHGYPPPTSSYTFTNIPVIVGEYGPGGTPTLVDAGGVGEGGFYDDLETKQIPNLAWDFEPYSNCQPDLLSTTNPANMTPTPWGTTVKTYLNAHAK